MNTPTPDPNDYYLEGTRTNRPSTAPPEHTQEGVDCNSPEELKTALAQKGFVGAIYAQRFPEALTNGAQLRNATEAIKEKEESDSDAELRRKGAACVYVPRQGFFSFLSIWLQSLLWLFGIYWHNAYRDECCPDFGCCSTCSTPFKARWSFIKTRLLRFVKG